MRFFRKHTTKKSIFTESEQLQVANAIAHAEICTSGELRVYIEHRSPNENALERAQQVFFQLEMDQTKYRNGILIYIALMDRKVAIFGDEGIYEKLGSQHYWDDELQILIQHLKSDELIEGLEHVIADLGYQLAEYFPFEEGMDRNELPDEIVFGDDIK